MQKVTDPLPFSAIAIIGGGLIGSSMARAIRRFDASKRIVFFDSNKAVLAKLSDLGLTDAVPDSAAAAVAGADLVILAIPVGAVGAVLQVIGTALAPKAVLTDVGSVKATVLSEMQRIARPDVHLIPAHPVAGTEQSGPEAGFASLFDGRWCILTPDVGADPAAVDQLGCFWQALGAKVEVMDAAHHDLVLAITSHVPHLIAYNIVGTASDLETVTESEVIKYSAGGFRDFTRIAASDPVMWRDVFLHNREAVLEMLGRFSEDLSALARAIRWGDGEALQALFSRTRDIRRSVIDAGQDAAAPDFGRPHDD